MLIKVKIQSKLKLFAPEGIQLDNSGYLFFNADKNFVERKDVEELTAIRTNTCDILVPMQNLLDEWLHAKN
jgi:hypothetical protein